MAILLQAGLVLNFLFACINPGRGTPENRRRSHLIKCYSYATWPHVCLIPLAVSRYANTIHIYIVKHLDSETEVQRRRNFLWRAAIFPLQLNVDYKMLQVASGKRHCQCNTICVQTSANCNFQRLLQYLCAPSSQRHSRLDFWPFPWRLELFSYH